MTVTTTEMASQVSQLGAARESEAQSMNAARLDNWRARYPYDPADVPTTSEPPSWPCVRSSISIPAAVTKLRAGGARG